MTTNLFRLLSLDPGQTTGWATWTATKYGDSGIYTNQVWECGQLGPQAHHNDLEGLLELQAIPKFQIVCESFEYRNAPRMGLVLSSVEYIGVVKRFCDERHIPIHFQTASKGKVTKKSFVRKETLEKLGLWVKGGASSWNHAMDAYGHLITYMVANNIIKDQLLNEGWK